MTAQPCDWRDLTCHDARTIADLAHRYGWMVVGSVTEPTWDSTGNTDQSLMLLMGTHDGKSAVRILAHWIDVDRHGIAHHDGCTVEDIDADLIDKIRHLGYLDGSPPAKHGVRMTDERNATQRVHPLHPDNIAALGRLGFTVVATESYDKTLSEIERLRAWKAEATEVLATWENVWEAVGRPGELGASKAQACLVALFPSRKPAT